MVYIAYNSEINLQICNYTQIRWICRELTYTRPTKELEAFFRLPKACQILPIRVYGLK